MNKLYINKRGKYIYCYEYTKQNRLNKQGKNEKVLVINNVTQILKKGE
jgi:hypothetical protein